MRVLAIDPGPALSAYVVVDSDTYRPLSFDKVPNFDLRHALITHDPEVAASSVVIESITSFGWQVGQVAFDTCTWIGRFDEQVLLTEAWYPVTPEFMARVHVKQRLCGKRGAKESEVTAALVQRFTPGARNYGKGTDAEPGWFHGFKADVWQAYALAVAYIDRGC